MTPIFPNAQLSLTQRLVAPRSHTAMFIGIFLGLGLLGSVVQGHRSTGAHAEATHAQAVALYVSLIAMELGLLSFVRGGLARQKRTLASVLGTPRRGAASLCLDVAVAVAMWTTWLLIQYGWQHVVKPDTVVSAFSVPRDPLEIVLWIAVSCCAGVIEEIAFRGYLQKQLGAWTGSVWMGVVLQAILFGLGHAYEGVQAVGQIVLFGLLFGVVAQWRRSLRAGMIAHAGADIMVRLFGI